MRQLKLACASLLGLTCILALSRSIWPSSQGPAHTIELLQDETTYDPCRVRLSAEDSAQLVQLQQLMSLTEIKADQNALQKQIDALKKKSGPVGRRGAPGAPGVCGPGEPGEAGQPGMPGANGGPGKDGRPGKKGKDGTSGRNGVRGTPGKPGRRGVPGAPGLPGKPGLNGLPGRPGRNGIPGKQGKRGSTGPMGRTGKQGSRGFSGRRGPAGKAGRNGRRGLRGRLGSVGKKGAPGFNGKSGKRGVNGGRGRAGRRGNRGVKGVKGPPGFDGKDKHVTHEMGHTIGMVIDAVTGLPIAGAKLTVYVGRKPFTASRSKDNGRYYVSLVPGTYRIIGKKSGYAPAFRTVTMRGVAIRRVDVVMSPKMIGQQTRFITTWNNPQLSLATFMRVPGKCVVSGATKRCNTKNGGYTVYDNEKCRGRGPQTITIRRWSCGKYYLWVKQLSNFGRLVTSRTVVRVVYGMKGVTSVHRIQNYGKLIGPAGKNNIWCVLKMDGCAMKNDKGVKKAFIDCSKVPKMEVQRTTRHNEQKVRAKLAKKAIRNSMKKMTPKKKRPTGILEGKVINVATGKPMRFVKVKLWRQGSYKAQVMSDALGRYKTKVEYGQYEVRGTRTKFTSAKTPVSVTKPRNWKDVFLSPKLQKGQLRIVLRWSNTPQDMDSYLKTPDRCIVWFRHRHCNRNGGKASLDVDNTRGKGPETITIQKCIPGNYYYFVKQYSRRGSMSLSRSLAQIYYPSGQVKSMRVGKFGKLIGRQGRGRTWLVFKFNCAKSLLKNGKVVPKVHARVPSRAARRRRRRVRVARRRRRRRRRRAVIRRRTNIKIRKLPRRKTSVKIRTKIKIRKAEGTKVRNNIKIAKLSKGGKPGQCVSCQDPSTFLKRHDYQGSDLIRGGVSARSPADCCAKCHQNKRCRYWTYGTANPRKGRCWLKKNSNGHQRQSNRESGRVCRANSSRRRRRRRL